MHFLKNFDWKTENGVHDLKINMLLAKYLDWHILFQTSKNLNIGGPNYQEWLVIFVATEPV